MLAVDPAKFNSGTVVAALGQAFFSLSVGMGIMVTYGSYVPRTENLAKSGRLYLYLGTALWPSCPDLPLYLWFILRLVPKPWAWEAGLLSWLFLRCSAVCPAACSFGFAFFLLLFVAALTSAISILESCIAWLTEEFGFARLKATLLLVIPHVILKRRLFAVPGSHGHKAAVV